MQKTSAKLYGPLKSKISKGISCRQIHNRISEKEISKRKDGASKDPSSNLTIYLPNSLLEGGVD